MTCLLTLPLKGRKRFFDRASEVREGLDGGRQIFKKLPYDE